MKELELKLSLPDRLASQAKAAGLLTSEAIEGLVRQALRKAAAALHLPSPVVQGGSHEQCRRGN